MSGPNSGMSFHATAYCSPYLDASLDVVREQIADRLAIDPSSVEHDARVIWIAPEKTSIGRQQVNQLLHELTLTVSENTSRCVAIVEAHTLTPEAANALLKTLEEPPENVWFYMTTPSAAQLLPTIRSRVVICGVVPPAESISPESAEEAMAFLDGTVPARFTQLARLHADERLADFCLILSEALRQRQDYAILEWMQSHHLSKTSPNYRLYLEALAVNEVLA